MSEKPKSAGSEGTTLKELAKHLGLTKGTVSAVLNDSPYAKAIPQHTKDRIIAAARELNYQPNFFARTLRKKRTYMVGVVCAEIGDAYGAMVISGVESGLTQRKYFFMTVVHHHDPLVLQQYTNLLQMRGAEGLITVDTSITRPPQLPTVAIAGHRPMEGVTNIVLDHRRAADLVLKHLLDLGHRDIAFIGGQAVSSDTADRWNGIVESARELGYAIRPDLVGHLLADDPSPQEGYKATRELLHRRVPFTALFAYNDISAIGAMRAIQETGMRVPEDVSVVGFDDIREAAYHLPSLTTVRQPLREMGALAAQTVISRIEGEQALTDDISVEPELVVRESTSRVTRTAQLRPVGLSEFPGTPSEV